MITNIDPITGIHYGVISQHSICGEALEDVYHGPHSRDMGWERFQDEIKQELDGLFDDEWTDADLEGFCKDKAGYRADRWLDSIKDAIQGEDPKELSKLAYAAIEDELGDVYQSDTTEFLYECDGYKLVPCLDSDIFVLASPYFTFAQHCSPCVPNAGNLDNPMPDGFKAYCLGSDFFDGEYAKCPYPIYSVETGELVS